MIMKTAIIHGLIGILFTFAMVMAAILESNVVLDCNYTMAKVNNATLLFMHNHQNDSKKGVGAESIILMHVKSRHPWNTHIGSNRQFHKTNLRRV